MKKISFLLLFLLLPLSSFSQDVTVITGSESPNTITYSKPITNDTVLDLISQLDLTLFIRDYQWGNLYDNWKYESTTYPKTHSYLNTLFFTQIKPNVTEDTFFTDNFHTRVHLNLMRAYLPKDKLRLKILMTSVYQCYKKNRNNVSKYTDEKTFLNTECSSEINKIDEFLLLEIQDRLKVAPLISKK
jgi:hypothetical protein